MSRGKYSSSDRPLIHQLPSPGRRMTRATEVFRLPVPWYVACSAIDRHLLRRLGGMRMLRPGVDLQLAQLRPAEPVPRQHSLHGLADDLLGPPVQLLAQRAAAEAPGIARVPVVHLGVELVARDRD